MPVIGLLAGPWYYKTYGLIAPGFRYGIGVTYTSEAVPENLLWLLLDLGPIVLALALVGARRAWRRYDDRVGVCCVALVIGVLLFQCLIPAALQPRYMIPALPPLLLLAADGMVEVAALIRRARRAVFAATGALVVLFAGFSYALATKRPQWDMAEASTQAAAALTTANPVVLIAGDNDEESAGITELACATARGRTISRCAAAGCWAAAAIIAATTSRASRRWTRCARRSTPTACR